MIDLDQIARLRCSYDEPQEGAMDNITRLKAEAAVRALLMLLNELDRVHGAGYTRAFIEEHHLAINGALATIQRALERDESRDA